MGRAPAGSRRRAPALAARSRRPARSRDGAGPRGRSAAETNPPERRRSDLIYGRNAVLEAVRAGRARRVLMSADLEPDPRLDEIRSLSQVHATSSRRLDALTGGVHQGVAAELAPRRLLTLRQLLDAQPRLLVALDSVLDPQNLGAILRSAEAAGVEGVILPARRTAPLSPAAVKASSGASELLAIAQVSGLPSAIVEMKRAGIWCVALDPHGETAPWEFDLTAPVCLVVGGEGRGVHRLVRDRCDARLRLPMKGRIESLNAGAAAAALLYEVTRQRSQVAAGSASFEDRAPTASLEAID